MSFCGIDLGPPVPAAVGLDVVIHVPNVKKMRNVWKDFLNGVGKTSAFVSYNRLGK